MHVIEVRGDKLMMMWWGQLAVALHEPLRRVERMAVMPAIMADNRTGLWIDSGEGRFGGCV